VSDSLLQLKTDRPTWLGAPDPALLELVTTRLAAVELGEVAGSQ
jgi:hypothetical protein